MYNEWIGILCYIILFYVFDCVQVLFEVEDWFGLVVCVQVVWAWVMCEVVCFQCYWIVDVCVKQSLLSVDINLVWIMLVVVDCLVVEFIGDYLMDCLVVGDDLVIVGVYCCIVVIGIVLGMVEIQFDFIVCNYLYLL